MRFKSNLLIVPKELNCRADNFTQVTVQMAVDIGILMIEIIMGGNIVIIMTDTFIRMSVMLAYPRNKVSNCTTSLKN